MQRSYAILVALALATSACFGVDPHEQCDADTDCPACSQCRAAPGTYDLVPVLTGRSDFCTVYGLVPDRVVLTIPDGAACGTVETTTATTRSGYDLVETVIAEVDDGGTTGGLLLIEVPDEDNWSIEACAYDLVPTAEAMP